MTNLDRRNDSSAYLWNIFFSEMLGRRSRALFSYSPLRMMDDLFFSLTEHFHFCWLLKVILSDMVSTLFGIFQKIKGVNKKLYER